LEKESNSSPTKNGRGEGTVVGFVELYVVKQYLFY